MDGAGVAMQQNDVTSTVELLGNKMTSKLSKRLWVIWLKNLMKTENSSDFQLALTEIVKSNVSIRERG